MAIEAEVRSFLSKEKYEELKKFFMANAEFKGEDNQTTYYFDCAKDLRIQKNNSFSKVWVKEGKIHDPARTETEAIFRKEDFENLEQIFLAVGFKIKAKWFRHRLSFIWNGISISLDFTKGYGYIIELEKICEESEKDKTLEFLAQKLKELNVIPTPKSEFDEKYNYYLQHWQELVKSLCKEHTFLFPDACREFSTGPLLRRLQAGFA